MDVPVILYFSSTEGGRVIAVTGVVLGPAGNAEPVITVVVVTAVVAALLAACVGLADSSLVGVVLAVLAMASLGSGSAGIDGKVGGAIESIAASAITAVGTGVFPFAGGAPRATGLRGIATGAGAATSGAGSASMLRVAKARAVLASLSNLLPRLEGDACNTSTCAAATSAASKVSWRQRGELLD